MLQRKWIPNCWISKGKHYALIELHQTAYLLFAESVEGKTVQMKKQKKKQDSLILKMLPKDVVEKLNTGEDTAENFESATLFFRSILFKLKFSSLSYETNI